MNDKLQGVFQENQEDISNVFAMGDPSRGYSCPQDLEYDIRCEQLDAMLP